MKAKRRTPRAIRRASKKSLEVMVYDLLQEGRSEDEFGTELGPIFRALVRILKRELKRRTKRGWRATR